MKVRIVLTSCIALLVCAGNSTPLVPKDNSQYVEGTSRYIWMYDDDDTAHLVDLQEPVKVVPLSNDEDINNQYWLFTRSNPYEPQIIVEGNIDSVQNSNYAAHRPLNIVVHGWGGSGKSESNTLITSALLAAGNDNVIVVDWRTDAAPNYVTASLRTPSVGQAIGKFVTWLIETTHGSWNNVHLIGFSLGAHAVGNAGRIANGQPIRVTGLDPAGPGWNLNPNRLNVSDGRFVEVIHTDIGVMGILPAIGDADFYPNRGTMQPGCNSNQCSHSRAWKLYASSVRTNHFNGRICVNLNEAVNNQCTGNTFFLMGNSMLMKKGHGIYGLTTQSVWPF